MKGSLPEDHPNVARCPRIAAIDAAIQVGRSGTDAKVVTAETLLLGKFVAGQQAIGAADRLVV